VEQLHTLVRAMKETSKLQLHWKWPGDYSGCQAEHGPRSMLSLPVR